MRIIIRSRPALDDLRGIDSWPTREASPEFALRTLTTVRHRVGFLEDFPHGGRSHRQGTRVLRVYDRPYLIHHRLADAIVKVLRMRHEREDRLVAP